MNNKFPVALASLPKDANGFVDERKLIHLIARANLSIDEAYSMDLWTFVTYVEGKIEAERSFLESLCVAIYSSVGQTMSSKKFVNVFEKQEEPEHKQFVGSKESKQEAMDAIKKYLNYEVKEEDD